MNAAESDSERLYAFYYLGVGAFIDGRHDEASDRFERATQVAAQWLDLPGLAILLPHVDDPDGRQGALADPAAQSQEFVPPRARVTERLHRRRGGAEHHRGAGFREL